MASSSSKGDKQSAAAKRVAVIGAGVSGLAAAYKLKVHGINVMVFEAEERHGGRIRSISCDGLIWEEGANTMTESEKEVTWLLDDLGLREKQQFPISQNKRYIARNGAPLLVPSGPISFIKSNLMSMKTKFQILLEPFLWKKSNSSKVSDTHESVGGFFQRHFGKEVVDYLIDPFVAGTTAADPESLSMCHAFPELWNLEKSYGSVIFGAIQSKLAAKRGKKEAIRHAPKDIKKPRGSFSFLGGMQTLTNSLGEALGKDELRLNSKVTQLSCISSKDSQLENWSISYAPIGKMQSSEKSFDSVIITAPIADVKEMRITKEGARFPLDFLPKVDYLPLSVLITTFKKSDVKRPLEGFGVLIPSKEQQNGLKSLGTLFSSMMFPDRAPGDTYLYTTLVGGTRNKELAKASKDKLTQTVISDLRQLLGAEGEQTFVNHFFWSRAFPLYGLNYSSVIDAIQKMEKDLPGFFYAGNHRGGLSVGKAISSGCKAADLVIAYLGVSTDHVPSKSSK